MRTADEMRGVLAKWEESGLTQKVFGEAEGISVTTLQYWRRRLRELDEGTGARSFAPVRVIPDPGGPAAAFELRMAEGFTIGVPPSFDSEALQRLIATVREC